MSIFNFSDYRRWPKVILQILYYPAPRLPRPFTVSQMMGLLELLLEGVQAKQPMRKMEPRTRARAILNFHLGWAIPIAIGTRFVVLVGVIFKHYTLPGLVIVISISYPRAFQTEFHPPHTSFDSPQRSSAAEFLLTCRTSGTCPQILPK